MPLNTTTSQMVASEPISMMRSRQPGFTALKDYATFLVLTSR